MATRIHPTALIEEDVTIGDGTSVWDNVHIRHGSTIGRDCITKHCIWSPNAPHPLLEQVVDQIIVLS